MIFTGAGRRDENGQVDESVIYEQPPIAAGSLSDEDLDPERNIHYALSNFNLDKKSARALTKKALKSYVVPDGMKIATNSELAKNKPHWIDYNAGPLAEDKSFDDALDEMIDKIIRVASGEKANHEKAGFREIAIFKSGVTL